MIRKIKCFLGNHVFTKRLHAGNIKIFENAVNYHRKGLLIANQCRYCTEQCTMIYWGLEFPVEGVE